MNDPIELNHPVRQRLDLTACEREPIHIPGAIEPNGAMLVIDEPRLTILQASSNVLPLLGLPPESLLGMPLADLFSQKDLDHLIAGTAGEGKRHYVHHVQTTHTETPYDALVHRYHGLLIVEIEPTLTADAAGQSMCESLTDAIAELDAPLPLPALCERVAACVRRFTGFDRVMVYRFLNDDTGEVIAENKREDLIPYLGLRYPASDIPPQARRLYLLNTLRLKTDVNARSAVLIPELNPFTGAPLDMTFCILRSMSPVHVEYLRNMGVAASMSISIVKDGRLWGLIACHHAQAKLVPHPVRLPCEVLARVFSSHIAAAEAEGQRASATALQELNQRMQERMRRLRNAVSALSEGNDDIIRAIGAQGSAISIGGKLILSGITPARPQVEELLNWLGIHQQQHVFDTERMVNHYPKAAEFANIACGLLSMRVALNGPDFVLWFRPSIVQVIRWAGNPDKPVEETEAGKRISPRRSFEQWKQTLHDSSQPWTDAEHTFAATLRPEIAATLLLQLNEEILHLNAELARSNVELDTFAYTASHDLQEPVRTIRVYAQMMTLRAGRELSPESRGFISTIEESAGRMANLISGLLSYSTVGGSEPRVNTAVSLDEVLRWVLTGMDGQIRESGALITHDVLPVIFSDQEHMGRLLQNLISNAVKYRRSDVPPRIHLSSKLQGDTLLVSVQDNGQGFDPAQANAIFVAFKRLHGREVPGSGIGLATCKRILQIHNGRIWAESAGQNQGATFWFTLPNLTAASQSTAAGA